MARKPKNFQWLGFTDEQIELLDFVDFIGNNGWARNSQTEEVMPSLLKDCANAELSIGRITEAMKSIGYTRDSLHMLSRWESKRTTGKFGK
ncbi:MAG: hypothetical protein LCH31_08760 [Actinobacteria bacterium]|nr:hypothetical protein [Actinomycetota bacterium]